MHVTPTLIVTQNMSPTAKVSPACVQSVALSLILRKPLLWRRFPDFWTDSSCMIFSSCLTSITHHLPLFTYTLSQGFPLYFECVWGGGVTSVRLDNFPCYLCMTFRKMDPTLAACAWVLTYMNLIKIYGAGGSQCFPKAPPYVCNMYPELKSTDLRSSFLFF